MNWNKLNNIKQLIEIPEQSKQNVVLIFKHSTSCSISRTALDRLERNWKEDEMNHITPYYLDLLSFREISNQISKQFGIEHESPQVLIIKNGKVIYDCSHFDIQYASIQKHTKN